ncbi:MAG: protein-export chaperone SecB [Betaproteobacteria bacterium]|nr:protein-export chaperone SecB [Betaproteobacteria bacterium]
MKQYHDDQQRQISYILHSAMLTGASVKRDEINSGPPWGQDEVDKQSLNLSLKATPVHATLQNKPDHYMVKLPVTVEYRIVPKGREATLTDRVRMLVEVEYCGVFMVTGDSEQVNNFVTNTAPTLLFPYAGQTINDLVAKAGCLPMFLPPIDFAALKKQASQLAEHEANATRQ